MNRVIAAMALLLASAVSSTASATVITFDDQAAYFSKPSYVIDGMTFQGAQWEYIWPDGDEGANNGTNKLIWGWEDSQLAITRTDQSAFNLVSADLGISLNGRSSGSSTVTAIFADHSVKSFSIGLTNTFQTVHFGLNNVLAVVIGSAHAGSNTYTALDNVNVTAVPEPEIYAMLMAGLGLLGAVARRRNKSS